MLKIHKSVKESRKLQRSSQCTVVRAMSNVVRILTCLLTYLLIPRSTVLLEKLTGLQLVKKFPAIY
jgi:hypothetical protein